MADRLSTPTKRLTATERDRSGPNSVRSRAYRALLRSIDWALECGSNKWIDKEQREQAWEEFQAAGVAWKLEGKPASSTVLIPHDLKSLKTLPSHFLAANCGSRRELKVQTLFEKGSSVAKTSTLRAIAYSHVAEMAAVRRWYRHEHPSSQHQWSTYVVDQATAPYEDLENETNDEDEFEVDEEEAVQQQVIGEVAKEEAAKRGPAGGVRANAGAVSEAEASEEDISEVTVSEVTVSEVMVSEVTASEETASEETASEDASDEELTDEEEASEEAAVDEGAVEEASGEEASEDGASEENSDEEAEYEERRGKSTSRNRNPAEICRAKRMHLQAANTAIATYIDQHCKGKNTTMSGRDVCRAIAEANSIDYYDQKARRFVRRTARHYFDQMKQQVRQHNEKFKPQPRKTFRDLLEEGSALMPGYAPQHRSAAEDGLGRQTSENSRSPYILVEDRVGGARQDRSSTGMMPDAPPQSPATDADKVPISVPDTHSESSPPPRKSRAEDAGRRVSQRKASSVSSNVRRKRSSTASRMQSQVTKQPPVSRSRNVSLAVPGKEISVDDEEVAMQPEPKRRRLDAEHNAAVKLHEDEIIAHHSRNVAPGLPSASTIPPGDSTVFNLLDRPLAEQLGEVYTAIKHGVEELLMEEERFDGVGSAKLNPQPSRLLEATYQHLIGPEPARREREAIEGRLTGKQLAVAVLGSAMFETVFRDDCSTSLGFAALGFAAYASQKQAAFAGDLALVDETLRTCQSDFDTVLRQTYLRRLGAGEFQHRTVASLAACLARHPLSDILREHLQAADGEMEALQGRLDAWLQRMAEGVSAGILLKCELSCARETYSFRMPRHGQPFNPTAMEDPFRGNGAKVLVGLFPGLSVEMDGAVKVVSKAVVRTT